MEFRLAILADLSQLKKVYKDIIQDMKKQNIEIWDEIYPCEFFAEDIIKKQLYVLFDKDEIISAFALTKTNIGEIAIEWEKRSNKVFYLDRLGVNKKHSGKGIGSYMLNKTKDISKSLGAEYLRLFVVDMNKPAISLYKKMDLTKLKVFMKKNLIMVLFYMNLDMR